MSLLSRLETHFAVCSTVAAAAVVMAPDVDAAIVYSGFVNISIPANFAGVYLNLVTGQAGASAASSPGFDCVPYFGGHGLFMSSVNGNYAVGSGTSVANLSPVGWGPYVGPDSSFITTATELTTENFASGVPAYIGLRFRRESDNMTLYGWVRIIKSAAPNIAGTIVDYAYESNGQAIPGPAAPALLALGTVGIRRRRACRE